MVPPQFCLQIINLVSYWILGYFLNDIPHNLNNFCTLHCPVQLNMRHYSICFISFKMDDYCSSSCLFILLCLFSVDLPVVSAAGSDAPQSLSTGETIFSLK